MAASSVVDLPREVLSENVEKKENGVAETEKTENTPDSIDYHDANDTSQSNIGHKLLLKQGWQAGQGLGKDLQGPVDAVKISPPHDKLSADSAKTKDDEEKDSAVDENADERTADGVSQTTIAQDKEKAKEESLCELKSSFYCELCEKQYVKHSEYDNHINSYDHAHKQRLKELRQKDSAMKLGGSREKDEKKLEKEMKRISDFADARAEKSPATGSDEHDDPEDDLTILTPDLQSLTDLDVNSHDLCGLSQEQKTFLLELKAAIELRQNEPDVDMSNIPLPPPPTTVFFHDESQAPPLPLGMELDAIPIPEPSLDAIPMPDTPAPLPTSLPSGPAPPPKLSSSAQEMLSKIFTSSSCGGEGEEENRKVEAQFVVDGDGSETKKKHHTIIFQNKGGIVSFSMSKKTQSLGGPSVFDTAKLKPIKLKRKKKEDTRQSKISEMEEEKRREEEERRLKEGDDETDSQEPAELYPNSPSSKLRPKDFKFVMFMKSQEAKREEEAAAKAEVESQDGLLSFVSVKNMADTQDLSWPGEMVKHTKSEPHICYSCNPLQFDFTSLFPSKKNNADSAETQSEGIGKLSKKKKSKKHGKRKKKSRGDGEEKKKEEEKSVKKKKKKKRSKNNKKETEEKCENDEEKVKSEGDKKSEKISEKDGDSGTEGGDEGENKDTAKPKKKRYRKRKADSDSGKSGDEAAEQPLKKLKKIKTKDSNRKKSGIDSGDEKQKKSLRKRKKKSKPSSVQGSAEKSDGKSAKRQATADGGSDKKRVKNDKTAALSIAAQQTLAEEGGRVSDFESKEGISKPIGDDHAGKSKWDTSSDSELETILKMKDTLKERVKKESGSTETKADKTENGSMSSDRNANDIAILKEEGTSSFHDKKEIDRSPSARRSRRSHRDHSSDYSSSGESRSSRYRGRRSPSDSYYDRSSYSSRSYSDYTDYSDYSYYTDSSRSSSRSRYSYSSYSDSRSGSYSSYDRSRRRRRRYTRSYSRSYTRSRSRSRSRPNYSSRKSYDQDTPRARREMKSSPDKQFSSVLPKKDPPKKRSDAQVVKEPKHFDKDKLVAPVGKLSGNEEVKKELIQKVKDKKDDPEASSSNKTGTTPQVPCSSEKGPVLPLIGKAPSGARRRNPLDGDKKEEEVITSVASIPTPEESAKSIPLPDTTPKSTPPNTTVSSPTTSKPMAGKNFIGPTLPSNHPLAHIQDINENSQVSEQDRFQPIGPDDPLVFKTTSSSGDPVVVIPPEQEEMYKMLQKQAQEHAEKRRREEEGILSSDSDDEEKQGDTEENISEAVAAGSEIGLEDVLTGNELTPVEAQLQAVPTLVPGASPQLIALQRPNLMSASPQPGQTAIPLGAQILPGHQVAASLASVLPQPTLLGAPMFVPSTLQTVLHQPQLQPMLATPQPQMIPATSLFPQPAAALHHQALPAASLQHLQLRSALPTLPQQGLLHAGGIQLAPANPQPMLVRHVAAVPGFSSEVLLGQPGLRFLRPGQPF